MSGPEWENILLRLSILGVLLKERRRWKGGIFSEKGKFKEREFR